MLSFGETFASSIETHGGRYGKTAGLQMGAGFVFPGESLKESPKLYFLYFTYTGAEWKFLSNSNLIALADNERIQFGQGNANRDIKYGRTYFEVLNRAKLASKEPK